MNPADEHVYSVLKHDGPGIDDPVAEINESAEAPGISHRIPLPIGKSKRSGDTDILPRLKCGVPGHRPDIPHREVPYSYVVGLWAVPVRPLSRTEALGDVPETRHHNRRMLTHSPVRRLSASSHGFSRGLSPRNSVNRNPPPGWAVSVHPDLGTRFRRCRHYKCGSALIAFGLGSNRHPGPIAIVDFQRIPTRL